MINTLNLNVVEFSADSVGRALWEINKAAKRHRDAAEAAHFAGEHEEKSTQLQKQNEFYQLKDRVIRVAIFQNWAKLEALHRKEHSLDSDKFKVLFACVSIGGFLFHRPLPWIELDKPVIDLPNNWRVPAAIEGTQMPLKEALQHLNAFVETHGEHVEQDAILDGVLISRGILPWVVDRHELEDSTYQELSDRLRDLKQLVEDIDESQIAQMDQDEVDELSDELFEHKVNLIELHEEHVVTADLSELWWEIDTKITSLDIAVALAWDQFKCDEVSEEDDEEEEEFDFDHESDEVDLNEVSRS